jgi:hypothetical protein
LFIKRVIDELIRFPMRRKQLMTRGQISKVTKIMEPIRQGDEYIIPEGTPTWTNLLRFEWTKQALETPLYYEEMSRKPSISEPVFVPAVAPSEQAPTPVIANKPKVGRKLKIANNKNKK